MIQAQKTFVTDCPHLFDRIIHFEPQKVGTGPQFELRSMCRAEGRIAISTRHNNDYTMVYIIDNRIMFNQGVEETVKLILNRANVRICTA